MNLEKQVIKDFEPELKELKELLTLVESIKDEYETDELKEVKITHYTHKCSGHGTVEVLNPYYVERVILKALGVIG